QAHRRRARRHHLGAQRREARSHSYSHAAHGRLRVLTYRRLPAPRMDATFAAPSRNRVLLVDDEPVIRIALRDYLAHAGLEVTPCGSVADAQEMLATTCFDVVLADHFLADGTALDLIKHLQAAASPTPLIILTGHASVDLAVRAIREGAE